MTDAVVADGPHQPALRDLTVSFVPFAFGILAVLALSLAEPAVPLARARFSLFLAVALAIPALMAWAAARGGAMSTRWRLWWTFALLAYLVHFAYGYVALFEADFAAVMAAQGTAVAIGNMALTVVWIVDVIWSWITRTPGTPGRVVRALAHLGLLAAIATSMILFRDGTTRMLGIAAVVLVLGAALWPWIVAARTSQSS